MKKFASKLYNHVINPPSDEELARARRQLDRKLPVIWLLGKTGAGKTSIVRQLTGQTDAEIGNGFMPCTRASRYFDYPGEHPVLRFLDTRGLGEADYDADADLDELGRGSHALFVVARLRDGEQSAVLDALRKIRRSAKHIEHSHAAVIHTGAHEIGDPHDRQRAVKTKQSAFEAVWGRELDYCVVDFPEPAAEGVPEPLGAADLTGLIIDKLPELQLWLDERDRSDAEKQSFNRLRTEVMWYAATASASDAVPLVGLVSVPAVQGKMLHSLARRYGMEWNTRNFSEFIAALGGTAALRYAVSLGGRQLGKLIPGFGQLVGTAFAVSVSYASTYALGRAACSYLYYKKADKEISAETVKSVYERAMTQSRKAAKKAADSGGL
jgi:uncharacterized protein (DUF697 family)